MVSRKIKGFLAMVVGLFAVLLLVEEGAQAFQTNTCPSCRQLQKSTTTRRHIVGVETIGIALVSAMAGAATQVPKIQQLEGELLEARGALEQSREELISKIAELEDKLFLMDKAYEDQSAKFMVEYEKKKNEKFGASSFTHDIDFYVQIVHPSHPVTKGIKDFVLLDEVYGNMEVLPEISPLLSTDHPKSNILIGWTLKKENSKIVYIQPGHDEKSYSNPEYRKIIKQSISYITGVKF
jgi:hypothetical protein